MGSKFRLLLLLMGLLLAFGVGAWLSYRFFAPKAPEKSPEQATVLLEKIREVFKLTVVEGEFSELYGYEAYSGYFTWLWEKKALLRVKAIVAIGYDLNALNIAVDSSARLVRVGPLPKPQILSVDHSVDYYDVSTGIFESFSPKELTWINQRAKEMIVEKAQQSHLMKKAEEQAGKVVDVVRFMAQGMGWRVEVVQEPSNAPLPFR